jgi:hypothetical protein
MLFVLGCLWPLYHAVKIPSFLITYQPYGALVGIFLWGQAAAILSFGVYQWLYWNMMRRDETNQ